MLGWLLGWQERERGGARQQGPLPIPPSSSFLLLSLLSPYSVLSLESVLPSFLTPKRTFSGPSFPLFLSLSLFLCAVLPSALLVVGTTVVYVQYVWPFLLLPSSLEPSLPPMSVLLLLLLCTRTYVLQFLSLFLRGSRLLFWLEPLLLQYSGIRTVTEQCYYDGGEESGGTTD